MKKILLIDDDEDIHIHTRVIIEKAGYNFLSSFSGDEGLTKIKKENPDLIILDCLLPDKNGIQIYNALKKRPDYREYCDSPVVMLTGVGHSKHEIRYLLERGLNAYLEKPFGRKELLNIIENIFVTSEIKTRSEQLKNAIENTKNFLENLIQCCPVIIITTDVFGNITYTNKMITEVLGYDEKELIGKSLGVLLNSNRNLIKEMLSNDSPQSTLGTSEFGVEAKSGEIVPIALTCRYLRDHNENTCGLLAIAQDLSAQKQLEKELLEKERLTAIAESVVTINHKINNPLTPILGNVQLIRKDAAQLKKGHKRKLEIIEINAKKISEIIRNFNQLANLSANAKKYYGKTNMLEI